MTPNKTYAAEWLEIAKHDLGSAEILLEADHFTDTIGRDCQQAIEKLLKAAQFSWNWWKIFTSSKSSSIR